jgi:hypothetical protein
MMKWTKVRIKDMEQGVYEAGKGWFLEVTAGRLWRTWILQRGPPEGEA